MKAGAQYFVAGLLVCLSTTCHADDETTFSYLIPPETGIAHSGHARSAAFPGHGCVEAGAFLLPAPFGDAGMRAFVHANGTPTTCAFHTRNPGASEVSFPGGGLSTSSPAIDPSSPEASRETESVAAAPKPAASSSGMSVPGRTERTAPASSSHPITRRAGPANQTGYPARYRWVLFTSVLVLAFALLALLGMLLYRRWFSEREILARAVNRGLRRKEFHLEYQPVFYTSTRTCIGLEVALRWKNVTYGLRLDESERLRTLHAIAAAGRQLDVAVIADGVELDWWQGKHFSTASATSPA